MGSGPSMCSSYLVEAAANFPTVSSLAAVEEFASESQEVAKTVVDTLGNIGGALPLIGPVISVLIPLIASVSFSDVNSMLIKGYVNDAIASNELENMRAALRDAADDLWEVNNGTLTMSQKETNFGRTQFALRNIFGKFESKDHTLRKHPLMTMPDFARLTQALRSVTMVITEMWPERKTGNDLLLRRIDAVVNDMVVEFAKQRVQGIQYERYFSHSKPGSPAYCIVADSPWPGFRGGKEGMPVKRPAKEAVSSYKEDLILQYLKIFKDLFPAPLIIALQPTVLTVIRAS